MPDKVGQLADDLFGIDMYLIFMLHTFCDGHIQITFTDLVSSFDFNRKQK